MQLALVTMKNSQRIHQITQISHFCAFMPASYLAYRYY